MQNKAKTNDSIRVLLLAQNDYKGGAGQAVWNIHRMIAEYGEAHGIVSILRVIESGRPGTGVISGLPGKSTVGRLWVRAKLLGSRFFAKSFLERDGQIRSIAGVTTGLAKEINQLDVDFVSIHWLGDGTLSLSEILQIAKPCSITLHDSWALLGSRHFSGPLSQADSPASRIDGRLEALLVKRKRALWRSNLKVISPSKHLLKEAQQSQITQVNESWHLPNPIDTSFWSRQPAGEARKELGIPLNAFVILFVSAEPAGNPRKGADLLEQATRVFAEASSSTKVVLLDVGYPINLSKHLPENVTRISLRKLKSDEMRRAYSAASILAITSRDDNLPTVGLEAMACELPLIAFNVPGVAEYVLDNVSGWIIRGLDPNQMGCVLSDISKNYARIAKAGAAARSYVETNHSYSALMPKHADFLRHAYLSGVPKV